jgi:hypothetical protein
VQYYPDNFDFYLITDLLYLDLALVTGCSLIVFLAAALVKRRTPAARQ